MQLGGIPIISSTGTSQSHGIVHLWLCANALAKRLFAHDAPDSEKQLFKTCDALDQRALKAAAGEKRCQCANCALVAGNHQGEAPIYNDGNDLRLAGVEGKASLLRSGREICRQTDFTIIWLEALQHSQQ